MSPECSRRYARLLVGAVKPPTQSRGRGHISEIQNAQIALAELRARLDRLESIQAIERLKYRYWRACDGKDPEAFRACFVESGAEIDYGPGLGAFTGADALTDVYARLALRRDEGGWVFHDMHHGVHPEIEMVDPTTATGKWTFGFMRVNLVDRTIERASMEYRDTYVVENGEWRIQKSHVTPLTGFSMPIPEGTRVGPGPKPRETN